jgi:hypothetical protein
MSNIKTENASFELVSHVMLPLVVISIWATACHVELKDSLVLFAGISATTLVAVVNCTLIAHLSTEFRTSYGVTLQRVAGVLAGVASAALWLPWY